MARMGRPVGMARTAARVACLAAAVESPAAADQKARCLARAAGRSSVRFLAAGQMCQPVVAQTGWQQRVARVLEDLGVVDRGQRQPVARVGWALTRGWVVSRGWLATRRRCRHRLEGLIGMNLIA